MNFKDIHIGQLIEQCFSENKLEISRASTFFKCTEEEVRKMFLDKSLETEVLLRWSKLLEYDFFRVYSQHLILYAPVAAVEENKREKTKTKLPQFRKNIYTQEVIDFILDQIRSKEMTKKEVMERYRIPKTTLYKWIEKYRNN